MSQEEKLQKLNDFGCHELNLFAYFKDRKFFDKFVRPFLLNKMQKTFVDHFLLGNHAEVSKYAEAARVDQLNAAEKVLLVISLLQHNKDTQAAKAIVSLMEKQHKL